jgi:hypothetical protein
MPAQPTWLISQPGPNLCPHLLYHLPPPLLLSAPGYMYPVDEVLDDMVQCPLNT